MPQMKKLGAQLQVAMTLDIPAELVALVATTSHPKRLQDLFRQASQRLLRAHVDVIQRPSSAMAKKERLRCKALLDLVRARHAAVGSKKPAVVKMLTLMDARPPKNVVDIRKAA